MGGADNEGLHAYLIYEVGIDDQPDEGPAHGTFGKLNGLASVPPIHRSSGLHQHCTSEGFLHLAAARRGRRRKCRD